jgi:hypothetical protein
MVVGVLFGVPALDTSTSLGCGRWGMGRVLVDGVLYNRTYAQD